MKPRGPFSILWDDKDFVARLTGVIFDEAHCISRWGDFRPDFLELGRLQFLLPDIVFYATSATMSKCVLEDVCSVLHLRRDNTVFFHHSNDRPNVYLGVKRLKYPANSYKDLDFLLSLNFTMMPDGRIRKFLIFFDNVREAEAVGKHLRGQLPLPLKDKIKWFHARMSDTFREDEVDAIRSGDTWGLCVTDSFGMVSMKQWPLHQNNADSFWLGS